jgi:hypothetical protein
MMTAKVVVGRLGNTMVPVTHMGSL